MNLGSRVTITALAVVLVTAVLLLAVPAWSQDEPSKEQDTRARDSGERTSNTKTGESPEQTKSKMASEAERTSEENAEDSATRQKSNASGKKDDNDEKGSDEASKKDTNKKASEKKKDGTDNKDPIKGDKVEVRTNNKPKNEVNKGDVLVIQGNFDKPSNDASVTVTDGNTKFTFDKDNSTIGLTDNGALSIKVTENPVDTSGAVDLDPDKLTVVESTGVRLANNNANNNNKNGNGRGGRGSGFDCAQILRRGDAGLLQYNVDVTQNCVLDINNTVDGFDNRLNEDLQRLLDDLDDEDIVFVDNPDGQVLDTSVIESLPNTGGSSLSGGALIAGLALLGMGAGVSLWWLGSRRGGG